MDPGFRRDGESAVRRVGLVAADIPLPADEFPRTTMNRLAALYSRAGTGDSDMGQVTQLLDRARDGDAGAWDEIVALIYADLKHIAHAVLGGKHGGTLSPTGLVNECYLRMVKAGAAGVNDRAHFLALAARAMRQVMLNHARDKLAYKRGAGATQVTLNEQRGAIESEAEQLIQIDAALHRLSSEDERMVQVIECRVFAGLSESETAEAMQMSLRSCQRLWADALLRIETLMAA